MYAAISDIAFIDEGRTVWYEMSSLCSGLPILYHLISCHGSFNLATKGWIFTIHRAIRTVVKKTAEKSQLLIVQ